MNKIKRLILAVFLCGSPLYGESIAVGNLRGLNNGDASILINDNEAQDLLNVDITENGYGIKKRAGISLFKTIGTSTWGVRGGYFFRDIAGVDTIVHANNRSVFKSLGGGNYSAFITTDTAGSYYDFTDSQGYLYRFNSNRDEIARYDGSAVVYFPSMPKGDQGEAMPDRMAISGTTGDPNTVFFSKLADFTDYTTGIETADAFTESFGLPGQKINALKYACGRLIAWTNTTTSFWSGSSQFDGLIEDISTTVGCSQPSSVVSDLGVIYWQGQDGHFYGYDCNTIAKISSQISGSVGNYTGGESKSWLQTTQADFLAGTLDGTSANISPGDVVLSTWTGTDTSAVDFASGTLTGVTTTTVSGQVYLSVVSGNIENNGFETAGSGGLQTVANWTRSGTFAGTRSNTIARTGTWSLNLQFSNAEYYLRIVDASDAVLLSSTKTASSGWTQRTLTMSSLTGRTVRIYIKMQGTTDVIQSDFFISDGTTLVWYDNRPSGTQTYLDDFSGARNTNATGNIVSRTFDTAVSSPLWSPSGANWTANGNTVSFETQVSDDGSAWDSLVAWSTGSAPASASKRYIRYKGTLTQADAGTALPYIADVTLASRQSSGTFISQIKEIGTAITSWGNFTADDESDGGTIAYFIRTADSEAGIAAAAWSALTNGAQIGVSTNSYIQIKSSFTITAGTQNPTMQNFSVAWNEGTVTRTWGTVDKDHRVMWSLAENASAVPNSTYIYDPRFNSWLKYSVPFDAPARVGNSVYIGSTTAGYVYSWPSGSNDSGEAYTAYWKSKDYLGSDPFVEKNWERYSVLGLKVTGSNVDISYSTNTVGSTSNNFSLTDAQNGTFKRINANFRSGTAGTFLNMTFGNDDSDAPFEIYTFRLDYSLRPWRILP